MIIGICDDENVMREAEKKICRSIIQNYGDDIVQIETFSDGKEVLEGEHDILILDIEMEDVDGIAVKNYFQNRKQESGMLYLRYNKDTERQRRQEMLEIKLIAGALIGTALKIACDFIEQRLLLRRNITYSQSRNERIILHIIMALVGAIIMWKQNSLYTIIYSFILLMICEVIAVTDLHHRIIPNDLILAILAIKAAFSIPYVLGIEGFPEFSLVSSLLGLVAGFAIFSFPALLAKNVGAGDIKLAAAVGFCLGITNLLYVIVLMGICVLAYTVVQSNMAFKMVIHEMIPMGPFIAVAMVTVMNFC